ncbi:EAL domain-containing protein [Leptothoe sp. ISB3NOV94-8A]
MVTRVIGSGSLDLDSAIIRDPLVVSSETLVMTAVDQMAGAQDSYGERASCVVIVEAGSVVGILTERDVVRLTARQLALDDLTIADVIVSAALTLGESDFTDADLALDLLQRHNSRHLLLLNGQGYLAGVVTQLTLQRLLALKQAEQWQQDFNLPDQREDDCQENGLQDSGSRQSTLLHVPESVLNQSAVKNRAILSAIPDYLFCVDAQGVYREIVTHQKDITLFPEDVNPVGLSMIEMLPAEVATQQLFYLKEALRTGVLQTYEQQIQLGDQIRDEEVRVIQSGDNEVLFMIRDISDRKQAERQLQNLIEGTAATTGQDFFPALVRHIASALGVAYAIITELVGEELHALAFWGHGELHTPTSYHPAKTPCELTLRAGRFYCEVLLQQSFPDDLDLAEMGAESYLGIALHDAQGNVIGDLCILDTQPIQSPQRAEAILQSFAARATAELERQRAISSLEQLNQALEDKVAERTAELQEREQFLQTVLDTFPLSVFWKDLNSVYLGCNRNYLSNAGLDSVADIIGKTDFEIPWPRTEATGYRADDLQVMVSNTAKLGIIETLVKADGRRLWAETNKLPLHNLAGEVVGVLGTYQDITARKQLELELKNSQKQLSEVLDTAIAGITRFRFYPDASIQYDYISPHCEQNFGYTADELFPDAGLWQARIHQDDWEMEVLPTLQSILSTRSTSTHHMEYRFNRKDSSICWILANCFVQWNEAGDYWYVTVVDTDISDRKRAESQLQNLILGTAAVGQDFFPALARHIAEALDITHVLITECRGRQLHSLAVWTEGELQPNDVYPLVKTPCEQVVQAGIFCCEQSIQQQFPDYLALREMAAESYVGIALRDTKREVTGILCIFHQQPLQDVQRATQILQIFAARAAAELERQRANTALEQLNQALEIKVAERTAELLEREQFLQTVLDTFPLHIFWKDRNSVYLGGNRNFLKNAGLNSLVDIQGKTDYDLPWTLAEAAAYRADDRQVIESNTAKLGIMETQRKADGQSIWIETNKHPLHNLDGETIGVLGTFQDVTDHKVAKALIKQQLAAIEAAIEGISILQNDVYTYVNPAHLNLFGYTHPDELLGQSWQLLYSSEEVRRFEQDIFPTLECDRAWQGEAIATRKDGSQFPQGVSLTLMNNGLVICVCRDISDLKQAQEQITHNALHDPLTGLPNRRLLLDRIEFALQRSRRHQTSHYAVLFLDLDRFKVVNDSLGHLVGDKLLIEVSKRLKQHLRSTDMVARLGGDEFVILLEDVDTVEDIVQVVERILADCQTPILIDEHKIFTSTSIGIAIGSEDYQEAANLIRDADIAMYRAKSETHNSYKFFDAAMYLEAMSRLTLETDFRKAITQQEFVIHYQPIVSLKDSQLTGFEALIRWQHPDRGLLSPSEFIPMAEETNLVTGLDSWVINQTCEQLMVWKQQFPNHFPLKISINLSVQDLHRSTLLQDIDDILSVMSLTGDLMILEITESMLIEDIDIDQTIDLLSQLASRNIQISIDDFGTGYSSLSYLHRLPIHSLKIDRLFVGNMHLKNRNYQVISTILALGKQLGLTVVAEGIETPHHLQQLQKLGCDLGQGYLFSQPLTAHDVETILNSSTGVPRMWVF